MAPEMQEPIEREPPEEPELAALVALARQDATVRQFLRGIAQASDQELPALASRFAELANTSRAPAQFQNYIARGGSVEKLFQIAQAQNVFVLQIAEPPSLEDAEGLLDLPLREPGLLPTVRDTDFFDVGVTRSKYPNDHEAAPYVSRRIDATLAEALRTRPFTLLIGPSTSGKSRTAFEVASRVLPNAPLIVPSADPGALEKLFATSFPFELAGEPGLLLLDDLDRYLTGAGGLDLLLVERIARHKPQIRALATMKSSSYEALVSSEGDVGRTARLVIGRARVLELELRLTQHEMAEAQILYPNEDFDPGIGIGEQLVAAIELRRKYTTAQETEPAGWAVVQAAVDWERCGSGRPVKREDLASLYPHYLSEVRPDLDSDESVFANALSWARRPVASRLALLMSTQNGSESSLRAFGYIVAYADGEQQRSAIPVLPIAWKYAIEHVTEAAQLLRVAWAASHRDAPDVAESAANRASESEDDDVVIGAAFILGGLASQAGDLDEAAAKYAEVIDSRYEPLALNAKLNLAVVRVEDGDIDGAEFLLSEVIASGRPDVVSTAEANLGYLAWRKGDVGRARALLQRAIAGDQPFSASLARVNLGALAMNEGDAEEARTLFNEVIAAGSLETVPVAKANLGYLVILEGDVEGGRVLLEEAIASGNQHAVPTAQVNLAVLALNTGDAEGAKALLTEVIASRSRESGALAKANLGYLVMNEGDVEGARTLFQEAIDSGFPPAVAMGRVNLGGLVVSQGDRARAKALLSEVVASGSPEAVALAKANLGGLAWVEGDDVGARELLEEAIRSGYLFAVPAAKMHLAALDAKEGDTAGAKALLRQVIDAGRPDLASLAKATLGDLLMDEGDVEGGRALLDEAMASSYPVAVNLARLLLGMFAMSEGDMESARTMLREAMFGERSLPGFAPIISAAVSSLALVESEIHGGDEANEETIARLRTAAEDDSPLVGVELGEFLASLGDVDGARAAFSWALGSSNGDAVSRASQGLDDLPDPT